MMGIGFSTTFQQWCDPGAGEDVYDLAFMNGKIEAPISLVKELKLRELRGPVFRRTVFIFCLPNLTLWNEQVFPRPENMTWWLILGLVKAR